MSNRLVEAFRRDLASRGQVDPRDDDYLTLELGRAAEQNNRDLFDQFGDFAEEYRNLREANAPTLPEEAGRALKGGAQGLASTALGGLGLVTGSDYLKGKARSFDEDAAANAPTIPTLEDIAPGETAAGKTFSRDALRYGIAKVGSVAPSIGESLVTAGVGAAIGSAAAPVAGTLVGAVGGVLEKSLVKAAIKRLIAKGVAEKWAAENIITDASEAGIVQALKAGSKTVATDLAEEAAAIGKFRGGVAANAAGSLLLNSGDVASEGADTATTLALGVVSALPDTILPAYVLKKLFPGVGKKAAVTAGKDWLARHGTKIAELAGVPAEEFGQEYFQEAVNVVAKNVKEGNDPLKFDEADFRRLREAGIAGAAGGLLAAPGVMLSGREGAPVTTAKPTAEATRRAMAEAALSNTTQNIPQNIPGVASPVISPARRVARMTDEQKAARLAELSASQSLAPAEQQELELLRAIVGSTPAVEAPPAVPTPFVPAAAGATGVSPPLETLAASAPVAATPEIQNQLLAPAPVSPVAEAPTDPRAKYPEVFADAPEGQIPVEIQRADGSVYPAVVNGFYDMRDETGKGEVRPSVGRKLAEGWSHGMLNDGETILTPIPTPEQWAQGIRDVKATDSTLSAPAPAAVTDVTPNAVAGAAPLTETPEERAARYAALSNGPVVPEPTSAPAPVVPAITPAPVEETEAGAEPVPIAPTPETKVVPELSDVPPAPQPSKELGERLSEELAKPRPFHFGAIDESSAMTNDVRESAIFDTLTPETAAKFRVPEALGLGGNPSQTRIAVVLEAPDGRHVVTGLLHPQEMAKAGATGDKGTGPAVQLMATLAGGQKSIKEGGKAPALLADVIAAGYKVRAFIHFDAAPGKIFERFTTRAAYDAAFGATKKTTGSQAAKTIPTRSASEGVARRNALEGRDNIQRQIDALGSELNRADPARAAEINEEVNSLYVRLGELPEVGLSRGNGEATSGLSFSEPGPSDYTTADLAELKGFESRLNASYRLQNEPVIRISARTISPVSFPRSTTAAGIRRASAGKELRTAFERTLGRKIVFYEATSGTAPTGAGDRAGRGTIFVNVNASDALAALLGHEFYHTIEKQGGGVQLQGALLELAPVPDSYRVNRLKEGYSESEVIGEWIADLVGERFHEPEFWLELKRVAAARGQSSAFVNFVKSALDWLSSFAEKLRGLGSAEALAPALENIEQIRTVIAEALSDHAAGTSAEPRLATSTETGVGGDLPLSVSADRATQFATVAARGRRAGMRVDVFAKVFLQAKLTVEYQRRLEGLIARYQTASEAEQPALQRQIEKVQERLASIERVQGVSYGPQHITLGLDDVQSASMANLIALIHEISHSLLQSDPTLHPKVIRAAQKLAIDLHGESRTRTERTGSGEAHINDDYEELLVHTFAQRLAEEGVPDSPSLARAIIQWVKDLYYRLAMGVQAAFGREPSPQMALDWFENQLRRLTGGDYDYRFANLFARLQPETTTAQLTRQTPTGGTPGGIADYFDPLSGGIQQPTVHPDSTFAIDWNIRFATAPGPGAELDIPHTEATARIMAAATNELSELAKKSFEEAAATREGLTAEQWWAQVGSGESPAIRLAKIAQQVPGAETARIGGEKMTDAMNGLARVQAKALLYAFQNGTTQKTARLDESVTSSEKSLVDQAKKVNKLEGDLRNATMHEATFRDQLKAQIKAMAQGFRRGLDTASRSGELTQAVRDAEGLAENDPIPPEYEKLFKAVLADEIPLFDYVDAISKLDLPLADLTRAEFYAAIRDNASSDPALGRLAETRNRPLMVALAVLVKRNAEQVDMLQLRRADAEKFLAIHGDLKAIREAGESQLKELAKTIREDRKATTFADRLKRSYVEKRRKLRQYQTTIQEAEERRDLIDAARTAITAKVEDMETSGIAAPSEWKPSDGSTYLAMYQAEDGSWRTRERPLRFTREGPPVNAEQLQTDLAANWEYLKTNPKKAGAKTFELVRRQTQELANLDVQRTYPEVKRLFFEKWLLPSADLILSGGGAGAARAVAMLKKFQFIEFSNYQSTFHDPSLAWANQLEAVTKAAGLTDKQAFLDQIYDPVLYYIGTEPGREEGPALREAIRAAKRRTSGPVSEGFDEAFKDFLRLTKKISESFVKVAEDNGVFIADKRLGGELRNAVARGWMTVMRRMNAATVSTILREMDAAGWTLTFKDAKTDTVAPESFEKGVASGKSVVKATTFDSLMPWLAEGDEQRDAATAVLEDPQQFAQAISGFFTPNVLARWFVPFINKPGEPLFSDPQGEKIDQLDVQAAWGSAGGDVGAFIDALGARIGLVVPEEEGAEAELSPEADWRARMLRQIDDLYQMESRIAADSNQVHNLFDPQGRPAHLLMDARENDLLPPEHVQHMGFDPISSKNLLATLAFHAAFGRNGSDMVQALAEVKGELLAKQQAFQQLRGSTVAAKKANAAAQGYDYNALKQAAKVFKQVEDGRMTLEAAFGFGNEAGVLGDMRTGLQLLHFVAQQTTNTPKTGLLNLLQLGQRAIARRTIDPIVLRDTSRAGGQIVKQFFGQALESFGLHLMRASQHAKEYGAALGQGRANLSWAATMGIAAAKRGEEQPTAIKILRTASGLQSKGARIGFGESREFPRMANVPFASNVMHGIGLAAAISNGTAEATSLESLVKAAMDYFAANPDDLADPTFRLTAKDLRAQSAAWFNSSGSFDYFRRAMVDYGIGNLENVARGAMERAAQGDFHVITEEQALKAGMMSGNELDLQGSINTNPGVWASNPILKFIVPLLGWPLRSMNQLHTAMREADGRASVRAAVKAVGILAVWSLPLGLAFTFMVDQYDDKILKRKSNLGAISTDNSVKENTIAVLQRLSRAGNIYGLAVDFASASLSGLDPTSGQRPFSMDSRILAFSQLRTFADAISSWINSGFATTYANIERPLLNAMGGNGALQAIDIFNAALGIDNQEARITQRTNVNQWLRAAGREAGLELRRGGGGSVAPTPVSIWTREMWLSAIGHDRLDFLHNYRKAVDAAREEGAKNPEQKVLESWQSRNPLEVFRLKPSDAELQRTLSAMSDSGRQSTREALNLFTQYTALIAPSPVEKYQRQQLGVLRRGMTGITPDSLRRQMASQSMSFR